MSQPSETAVIQPAVCPFCESRAIVSTKQQKVTTSTYWRCETCGQVWHPERLRAGAPPRWGRR